jgi:hypothetical protein
LEQNPADGTSNMLDNFITDGAGSGGSLADPLKLLKAANKKKTKKYVDGTGPPSFTFTPLGSGVQGEMSDDTIKWLTAAALAVAKRQSDDEKLIEKLLSRTLWRFMQHLGITLMRAQAHMIFKYAHALANSRSQYITALPRGVRRAGHRRARGHVAGRAGAGGSHAPATRVGRVRARQLGASECQKEARLQ